MLRTASKRMLTSYMRGKPGAPINRATATSNALAPSPGRPAMDAVPETSVTVRLLADEHRFAVELAEVDGISISDAVRMSIRRAYEARFGQK
jgi:hypothetical protein